MYEEINPMGARIARVMDINGTRLTVIRRYPSAGVVRIQAYPDMQIHVNDHLKTDPKTQAVIEFNIGGRAGIGPDFEIVVVDHRQIQGVGNQVCVKAGKVWAKIDKQKSQLQIQTNGGVIGIEG